METCPPRSPTSSTRHRANRRSAVRERAAKTVDTALRGGILAGAVGAIAWLAATVLSGTIFIVLIAATVLAVVYTVVRGDKARLGLWGLIAIAWALVIAERWVVHDNGALIIAGATYLGRRDRRSQGRASPRSRSCCSPTR